MRRLERVLGAALVFAAVSGVVVFFTRGRLMRIAVHGHSMAPTLHDGDWLVAATRGRFRSGDIVVARDPRQRERLIVKRIADVEADSEIVLESDHPAHAGELIGPVHASDVLATVTLVYWPWRRIRRVQRARRDCLVRRHPRWNSG